MKAYEVGKVRYDGKVYFLIRRAEDASICVYPTKYLKHKTVSNRSPNTVKRIAFSLSYFMGYLKEQERQFEDVYQMTYSAQMEFFQNFLYWIKGGKHISGELGKFRITEPAMHIYMMCLASTNSLKWNMSSLGHCGCFQTRPYPIRMP